MYMYNISVRVLLQAEVSELQVNIQITVPSDP